jgi:pSer/pThr/pTyr-binding forkhead associated (FHA) protein
MALSRYIGKSMNDVGSIPTGRDKSMADDTIPLYALLLFEGGGTIALDKTEMTIGRSHDNEIVLGDPRVSRYHAKICLIKDHFVIFDLKSSGGTFINGQRIEQGILYPGDAISLGGCNFSFMQGSVVARRRDSATSLSASSERNTVVFNRDR